MKHKAIFLGLTSEGKHRGEDDMNPATVEVKHDAEVNGNAAQNCKAVDEGPEGSIQRDLTTQRRRRHQKISRPFKQNKFITG